MTISALPLSGRRYRAVILVILACSILCALGIWQLKRLAWKQELIATLQHRLVESPIAFSALPTPYMGQEWRPVILEGRFDNAQNILVQPRTLNGAIGAHVFSAFVLSDGRVIVVNRGFVPQGGSVDASQATRIEGIVRLPARGSFTPDNNLERNEWYWPDLATMLRDEKAITQIYIQQRGGASDGAPVPLVATPDLPNNHVQYAAFWFAMAGVCLLMFVMARKRGYA